MSRELEGQVSDEPLYSLAGGAGVTRPGAETPTRATAGMRDPVIRVILLAAGRLLDQAEPITNEAPPAIASAAFGTIRGSNELTHERRQPAL
jgi:hypothetical protein